MIMNTTGWNVLLQILVILKELKNNNNIGKNNNNFIVSVFYS